MAKYQILYQRSDVMRDGLYGRFENSDKDEIFNGGTHVVVKRLSMPEKPEEEALEDLFYGFNFWHPSSAEAGSMHKADVHHTSMSVGDVVYREDDNRMWVCAGAGWVELF